MTLTENGWLSNAGLHRGTACPALRANGARICLTCGVDPIMIPAARLADAGYDAGGAGGMGVGGVGGVLRCRRSMPEPGNGGDLVLRLKRSRPTESGSGSGGDAGGASTLADTGALDTVLALVPHASATGVPRKQRSERMPRGGNGGGDEGAMLLASLRLRVDNVQMRLTTLLSPPLSQDSMRYDDELILTQRQPPPLLLRRDTQSELAASFAELAELAADATLCGGAADGSSVLCTRSQHVTLLPGLDDSFDGDANSMQRQWDAVNAGLPLFMAHIERCQNVNAAFIAEMKADMLSHEKKNIWQDLGVCCVGKHKGGLQLRLCGSVPRGGTAYTFYCSDGTIFRLCQKGSCRAAFDKARLDGDAAFVKLTEGGSWGTGMSSTHRDAQQAASRRRGGAVRSIITLYLGRDTSGLSDPTRFAFFDPFPGESWAVYQARLLELSADLTCEQTLPFCAWAGDRSKRDGFAPQPGSAAGTHESEDMRELMYLNPGMFMLKVLVSRRPGAYRLNDYLLDREETERVGLADVMKPETNRSMLACIGAPLQLGERAWGATPATLELWRATPGLEVAESRADGTVPSNAVNVEHTVSKSALKWRSGAASAAAAVAQHRPRRQQRLLARAQALLKYFRCYVNSQLSGNRANVLKHESSVKSWVNKETLAWRQQKCTCFNCTAWRILTTDQKQEAWSRVTCDAAEHNLAVQPIMWTPYDNDEADESASDGEV